MRYLLLVAIAACVASVDGIYQAGDDLDLEDTTPTAQSSAPVTFDDSHPAYVDWHNAQGTFRIYKTCLGPNPGADSIGHDGTVGPGYVATVWNKLGDIVLDDTIVPAHIGPNGGATATGALVGATGLGMFGAHLVRKPVDAQVPFGTADLNPDGTVKRNPDGSLYRDHTWQLGGRWCNANRRPDGYGGYRGFGVRSWSSAGTGYYRAPSVSGNVGELAIEVVIGDRTSDLFAVRYTYRITSAAVKVWIRVTNLCSDGACDVAAGDGYVYISEPKVIAGVNPTDRAAVGITQMNIFNDTGHTATTLDRHDFWSNSCSAVATTNHLCEWGGQDPRTGTGQCNDAERRRARFWNPAIACADDPSCLVIAARAADTELGPSYPWQSGHGFDLWATRNASEHRAQANPTDTLADGHLENANCHGDSAAIANRRWEMAGYQREACDYTSAVVSFHAWEGGTGTYDCEPLYYKPGHSPASARESYVVALSYGFGAAPLP